MHDESSDGGAASSALSWRTRALHGASSRRANLVRPEEPEWAASTSDRTVGRESWRVSAHGASPSSSSSYSVLPTTASSISPFRRTPTR